MAEMKFELDHLNKKAYITGLDIESLGGIKQETFNALLLRLETLENRAVPSSYDLIINTSNGLKTVLSINNSQIGSSGANGLDLAKVFRAASIAANKEVAWSPLTVDGTSLEQRWNEGTTPTSARGIIEKGGLTHVVLQELSNRPLIAPDLFKQYAELFIDLIRQYNPNCLIYLFENWSWSDATDWQANQSAMNTVYRDIAGRKAVNIIPAGTGWNILRMYPGFSTLNPYVDTRHPSNVGIYLNAMIALRKILGVEVINNAFIPPEITNANALLLRDIASKAQYQNVTNSFTEFTFNAVNIKEGAVIKNVNFRTTFLEVYAKDINWNNGAVAVTNHGNQTIDSALSYPTINQYSSLIYQTGKQPIGIAGTSSSPQLITGLDPTLPIYWAVNDYSNYSNNTGSLVVGYR